MAIQRYYSDKAASTAFYDVLTAADRSLDGDLDLYASLAAPGGSILELGSGAGRVAQALAARGHVVTGLEFAPSMIALAEAKRATAPAEVWRLRYLRGDITREAT